MEQESEVERILDEEAGVGPSEGGGPRRARDPPGGAPVLRVRVTGVLPPNSTGEGRGCCHTIDRVRGGGWGR